MRLSRGNDLNSSIRIHICYFLISFYWLIFLSDNLQYESFIDSIDPFNAAIYHLTVDISDRCDYEEINELDGFRTREMGRDAGA